MTMLGFEISYTLLWTILAVVFAILEGLTLGLTTIWFAVGSLAALVMALLGFGMPIQLLAFVIVALMTLAVARPMAQRVLKVGDTKTNVDSILGKRGIIHVAIEPFKVGQAKVNGQIWTAKGETEETEIGVGTEIVVLKVDGVKLIVKPYIQ